MRCSCGHTSTRPVRAGAHHAEACAACGVVRVLAPQLDAWGIAVDALGLEVQPASAPCGRCGQPHALRAYAAGEWFRRCTGCALTEASSAAALSIAAADTARVRASERTGLLGLELVAEQESAMRLASARTVTKLRPDRLPLPATLALGVVLTVIFALTVAGHAFVRFAASGPAIREGHALAGLVTAVFMHASVGHLLSNLYALWIFGTEMEERFGPRTMLLSWLGTGVVGNVAFVALHPTNWVVGASGGLSGLMGLYLVTARGDRARYTWALVLWMIQQVALATLTAHGIMSSKVGFDVHVSGALCGMLLGYLLERRERIRARADVRARARERPGAGRQNTGNVPTPGA
jgi:rhomboid protease GluP